MSSPYDLIEVCLYDIVLFARPVGFSGTVVDTNRMVDEFGRPVVATSAVVTCPACGCAVYFNVGSEPLCDNCERLKPKKVIVFLDPIKSGRLKLSDVIDVVFNPNDSLDIPVDLGARRLVFSDFFDNKKVESLPKSDLGLEEGDD